MTLYAKDGAVGLISGMIRAGRLSHAFLICGEKGVGKKTVGRFIAKQILCEKKSGMPCGECESCLSFDRGLHHDFYTLSPSGKRGYLMNDLREIVSDAPISPDFGDKKVYFIPNFDTAAVAAQNVLLKIIEEPPPHVVFILTADSRDGILPTVLSRTICVNISPASEEDCKKAVLEAGFSEEQAESAISLFGGNIGRCIDYLENDGAKRLPEAVQAVADAMLSGDEYLLLKTLSSLEKDREFCAGVLGELKTVIRDAAAAKLGAQPCSLCRKSAAALSKKLRQAALEALYDSLSQAERKVNGNASMQTTLADLCGRMAGVI